MRGPFHSLLLLNTLETTRSVHLVRCYDSALAARLGMEVATGSSLAQERGLILRLGSLGDRLELAYGPACDGEAKGENPFSIDFCSPSARVRQAQAQNELSVKALGKASRVIDLTAGLGRDSVMFAASRKFNEVVMVERNEVLFFLLQDAVKRLKSSNTPSVGERIRGVIKEDGCSFIPAPITGDTAVFLDPMYPEGSVGRKSAVKKETQILHRLVDPQDKDAENENNAALFESASRIANTRIVVKRPLNAKPLDLRGLLPHESLFGSTQRFDIYFKSRL